MTCSQQPADPDVCRPAPREGAGPGSRRRRPGPWRVVTCLRAVRADARPPLPRCPGLDLREWNTKGCFAGGQSAAFMLREAPAVVAGASGDAGRAAWAERGWYQWPERQVRVTSGRAGDGLP